MFMDLCLSDHDKEKMQLFKILANSSLTHLSIHSLVDRLPFSYTKIQNLLTEINLDFIICYRQPLLTNKGQIDFCETLFDVGSYQAYLLHQSTVYQFFLSMLLYPDDLLVDYCEQNDISRSTVHRKLTPLKRYLKTLNLNLNLERMCFSGSEAAIRAFYLQLFWLTNGGQDVLEFPYVQENLAATNDWSENWGANVCYQQGRLALAITLLRSKSGNFIKDNQRCKDYLFPTVASQIHSFFMALTPDTIIAKAELNYFYYSILYQPIYLSLDDPRVSLARQNLAQLDCIRQLPHSLLDCVRGLLRDDLHPHELELFWVNFYNLFATVQLWSNTPVPLILRNSIAAPRRNPKLATQIQRQLAKTLQQLTRQKKTAWLSENLLIIAQSLTYLILPFAKPTATNELLRVGIQDDPNSFLIQDVLRFCQNLPFVKIELFNSKAFSDYDLIVSNNNLAKETTENCQLFSLQNGNFSYANLLSLLEKQQLTKMAANC
ncbi:MAG TPA: helix-turn-helix domain-containing protein [Lapidilactobacillus dextrinicus]|uniref:Helix-turn-helix domain-containing protein n=1 Tax=Lapidilactobacillus dextrinicus TaxID=51664 RepID=A0A921B4D1_9LACO|nr:helix-turn-helix domain-containing protein [Lapidilactobacillus dextrinicus]